MISSCTSTSMAATRNANCNGPIWAKANRPFPRAVCMRQPNQTHTLTVNGGSGSGSYTAGTTVNISANTPTAGQQFAGWIGDTSILASASAASTVATMPSANAMLTATYANADGAGTGLRAEYYNDSDRAPYPLANPFAGSPVLTRTDGTVDFNWSGGSPGVPTTTNFFSVKWTGHVRAPVSGTYVFTVTGDDGVRLLLNGVKVIDGWRDQGATAYTHTTTLTAGTLYNIELHYYEHEGDAACRLQWTYRGQAIQRYSAKSALSVYAGDRGNRLAGAISQ